MPSPRLQYLQRAIDQVVGRLASGETDLLFRQNNGADSTQLLERAAHASAMAALGNNEALDTWRKRQQRRISKEYHAILDIALENAKNARTATLEQLIENLSADGVTGLSLETDELSLDEWTDVPSLTPLHPGRTSAGITGLKLSPRLSNTFPRILLCDVDIAISLPHTQRGAHMSRLQSALIAAESVVLADLDALAVHVGESIAAGQPNDGVRVRLDADARFETSSLKTKLPSYVGGRALIEVEFDGEGKIIRATRGLVLDIATACPCTLRYSRLAGARDMGLNSIDGLPPTFTHSQPGSLKLWITDRSGMPQITFAEAFRAAGTGAHLREAVLKRPDEHDLVERMHRRPQFAEDVVRSVAGEIAASCDGGLQLRVEAHLDESIHPHCAHAVCSGAVEEFWSTAR